MADLTSRVIILVDLEVYQKLNKLADQHTGDHNEVIRQLFMNWTLESWRRAEFRRGLAAAKLHRAARYAQGPRQPSTVSFDPHPFDLHPWDRIPL